MNETAIQRHERLALEMARLIEKLKEQETRFRAEAEKGRYFDDIGHTVRCLKDALGEL